MKCTKGLNIIEDLNQNMTLIIGARCTDGVVLIADRKAVEGGEIQDVEKIKLLHPENILFSGAGLSNLFDKFVTRVNIILNERKEEIQKSYIQEHPNEVNKPLSLTPYKYTEEFITECENILSSLSEQYKDIINSVQQGISVLIAFRAGDKAELHCMDSFFPVDGIRTTYIAVGSGSDFAKIFLKELWDENLTMGQMALVGAYIIDYIDARGLDNNVGSGHQIYFIPDLNAEAIEIVNKEQKDGKLSNDDIKKFEVYSIRAIELKQNGWNMLSQAYTSFSAGIDNMKKNLGLIAEESSEAEEKNKKLLEYINQKKGSANTNNLAEILKTSKDEVNELIDYLAEKEYIKVQAKLVNGNQIGIKILAKGIDYLNGKSPS